MDKFNKLYTSILVEAKSLTGKTGSELMDKVVSMNRLGKKYEETMREYVPKLDAAAKGYIDSVIVDKNRATNTYFRYQLTNGLSFNFWLDTFEFQYIRVEDEKRKEVGRFTIYDDYKKELKKYLNMDQAGSEKEQKLQAIKYEYEGLISKFQNPYFKKEHPEGYDFILNHLKSIDFNKLEKKLK